MDACSGSLLVNSKNLLSVTDKKIRILCLDKSRSGCCAKETIKGAICVRIITRLSPTGIRLPKLIRVCACCMCQWKSPRRRTNKESLSTARLVRKECRMGFCGFFQAMSQGLGFKWITCVLGSVIKLESNRMHLAPFHPKCRIVVFQ
jgi:hypothetical protein